MTQNIHPIDLQVTWVKLLMPRIREVTVIVIIFDLLSIITHYGVLSIAQIKSHHMAKTTVEIAMATIDATTNALPDEEDESVFPKLVLTG